MSRLNEGDMGHAAGQLKDKVGEVTDSIRDIGGQVGDAAREQYARARDSAREYYEAGRERAKEFESDIENYVREQPMKSLLIAAGVGVLVGILWRRH